jgi:Mce-associated membrane protein
VTAPEAPADRSRRTVPAGAFVVAVMVAAALAILAVFALDSGGDGDGGPSDQELRLAAGRFTEEFLTYDGGDFDAWKADVLALSTGGFAEEFEQAERGLRVFFEEGARDAVAQVNEVFVGQEDRGAVEVVVVYDRDVSGGEEEAYTETDRYLQLSMLRIDGQWLVDNVTDIATASDLGAPPTSTARPEAPGTSAPDASGG